MPATISAVTILVLLSVTFRTLLPSSLGEDAKQEESC